MKLAIIAAIGNNRVIGSNGKLPWHIPDDLKRFKRLTTGHAVLMGRRTYKSIGKPLPNRRNVVVSSRDIEGVECYPSVDIALDRLRDESMVFVIGGAQLYRQFLDRADYLYLTLVDQEVAGDTFFPEYSHLLESEFHETFREQHDGYVFADYERVRGS